MEGFNPSKNNGFPKGHLYARDPKALRPVNRDLREGVLDAAIAVGSDGRGKDGLRGYLKFLAAAFPKQFVTLLAKTMPTELKADLNGSLNLNHTGAINIVAVPSNRYLSVEEVRKQTDPQPPGEVIEHDPAEVFDPIMTLEELCAPEAVVEPVDENIVAFFKMTLESGEEAA